MHLNLSAIRVTKPTSALMDGGGAKPQTQLTDWYLLSSGVVPEPQGQVEEAREGRGAGSPTRPAFPRPPVSGPSPQSLPGRRTFPSSPPPSLGICLDSCCSCSGSFPQPCTSTPQWLCPTLGHPTRLGYFPGHSCHVPPPRLYRTHFWQVRCSDLL